MKREYIQPEMLVVKLQNRTEILVTISSVTTTNADVDLHYGNSGGDQSGAWVKQNNLWDEGW